MLNRIRSRVGLMVGLSAIFALAVCSAAMADTTYDLSPVTSGITSQVQAVLTTVLPIAGGLLALFVGWKLIKRMVKA